MSIFEREIPLNDEKKQPFYTNKYTITNTAPGKMMNSDNAREKLNQGLWRLNRNVNKGIRKAIWISGNHSNIE